MVPVAQETTVNTVRLPYSFSRRFSLVAWCEASLEILHVHPLSLSVLQELQRGLNAPFTLRQIDGAEFEQRLNAVWQRDSSEARQLMEDLGSAEDFFTLAEELPETEDLLESDDDAPIIKLINAMLAEAIKEGASDIHIETFEKSLVIRFRVDGTLHDMLRPGRKLASLLVSRIKVMARLDIAEKRVPQDGRIALLLGGRAIDVRVSTMPSAWGERVVLRLLDKNQARLTLERLIQDGRIHPTKIEEYYEKSKKEVDATIRQEGEKAVLSANCGQIHPELVKLLGKLRYRTSYGQNVLKHSLEVSYIAGLMAAELGANEKLARRAGLLHDIGKALDHEMEGSHIALGVEYARKYKENEDVVHAIQAHHGDVECKTIVACLVQAADAVSAARPGARRENSENYIKRLQQLEEISSSFPGVKSAYAIQAGREVRVMVAPEKVSDEKMPYIAHEIAKKIESEMEYPGQIKVNIIRESRVTDVAK